MVLLRPQFYAGDTLFSFAEMQDHPCFCSGSSLLSIFRTRHPLYLLVQEFVAGAHSTLAAGVTFVHYPSGLSTMALGVI